MPTTPSATAHGGTKALEYLYNISYAANTYAITSGFNLVAGVTYTIKFWERVSTFFLILRI